MERSTPSFREAKRSYSCQPLGLAGQSMMIQRGMYGLFFCPITAIPAVSYGWKPARNHGDTTKTVSPGEIIERMNQTQDERTDDE